MATYVLTAAQLNNRILNSFSIPAASTVPTVSDPNAQAFLNAAVITDVTQANAVNSLVIGLKADGLWDNMRALYPIVGGTASTHKWNLKDPRDLDAAYRLQFNGGFTHNANGFNGNGSDGFANTYINNITIPTIGMYSRNFLGTIGSWNSDVIGEDLYSTVALFMAGTLANMISTNSYVEEPFWNNPSLGIGLNTVVADSINRTYTNGVASGTYTPLVSGADSSPMPIGIGAIITNGNVYNSNREYSAAQVAFAFVSSAVLNATQNANLYTRIQTFQTSLGRQVGVPIVSDSNAQAFLNAAEITNVTQANAVNDLVIGLKADGLWTNMQALYPFVGGTASTHKWNLKDPRDLDAAYRLQFGGGWVHNSNGATGNGTNTFANTYFIGFNQGQIGAYSRDTDYFRYTYFGGANILSAEPSQISPWIVSYATNQSITSWFSNSTEYENQLYIEFDPTFNSTGFVSLSGGNGSVKNYRNGTLVGELTPRVNPSPLPIPIYLGASNINSPYNPSYGNANVAFGFITTTVLNGTQNVNLYNRVQTFQTALSRQV